MHLSYGHLKWSNGGCLASVGTRAGSNLVLTPCNGDMEDQVVEMGVLKDYGGGNHVLEPLEGLESWRTRQARLRSHLLSVAMKEVAEPIAEAANKPLPPSTVQRRRRAVVFYLDRGSGFLSYLNWWLLAWRLLGLNSAAEAFDIVLFAHPESVEHIPAPCSELETEGGGGGAAMEGAGKCLFVRLVGISHRNKNYDSYLNSHECLVNPVASFLPRHYTHLLRY